MGQADKRSVADVVALQEERARRNGEAEGTLGHAGAMLRAAREALGLSVHDVALRTNIKAQNLAAIEEMNREVLPSQPYTMGFVRAYAREVSLPEDALMERFRREIGYEVRDRASRIDAPRRPKDPDGGRELSVLLVLAIVGFVLFCVWKLLISASPELPEDASRFTFSKDDQTEVVRPAEPSAVPAEAQTESVAEEPPAGEGQAEGQPTASQTAAVTESVEPVPVEETPPVQSAAEAAPEPEAEALRPLRRLVAVDPVYPPLCEGNAEPIETVTVAYTINGRGRPTGGRITSSSNPCFNGAALAALERWRYDPGTVRGDNARQTARFTFDRPY
ncbi:TonB family protein [Parvularcula maris]|uniref:TonB family protein n=1 Tax=Parvularcula maris TaxID=2965077 RepID=A0A9X2LAQ3_9PROT|nr:TonB family protein [Parvularcula maris]MCQ8185122.1 TonB family protein [Parvularcula maris]